MVQHPSRSLTVARWLALAATACGAVAMVGPVARAPRSRGLGLPDGEAIAHLWGLVTTAEGLPRHGPFVRDSLLVAWPGGARLDLVDPVHALVVAPGLWLGGLGGAVLAWNLLHLGHLLVLALGAWLLARHLAPERPLVAAVATAGAVATPYLWSGVLLGRSELLGLTLLPLLLALLGRAMSPGSRWPTLAGAALVLAFVAHHGWQPLMQSGLLLAPTVLVLGRHHAVPWRRLARTLALVVVPAALLSLPMLAAHLAVEPWWTERLGGVHSLGSDAPAVDLPGALRLAGRTTPMSMVVPPYLGWGTLLLLALALVSGPRRWALLGVGLVLLVLGPRVHLGDPDQAYLFPAWLLARAVPLLGGLNDWGRLALGVGPLLAVVGALALGPRLHGPRGSWLAAGVSVLLLADGLSYRVAAPQGFAAGPPAEVAELYAALPAGPVLELPGISPADTAAQADSDRAMLWSLSHRHPVQAAPSPHGSPMLPRSLAVRAHLDDAFRPNDPCLRSEEGRLYALGFRAVVLHHDRVPPGRLDAVRTRLRPGLGDPDGSNEALSWWLLGPRPTGPARCAPPPLGSEGGGPRTGPERFGPPPLSRDWVEQGR